MASERPDGTVEEKPTIRPMNRADRGLGGFTVLSDQERKLPSRKKPFQPKEPQKTGPAATAQNIPAQTHTEGTRKTNKRPRHSLFPQPFKRSAVFLACLIAAMVSGAVFFAVGRHFGRTGAEAKKRAAVSVEPKEASEAQFAEFESALHDLQNGMVPESKNILSKLLGEKAPISSLALVVANAALLDGDIPLAERCVKLSLERGESVSDALVLQAIIEAKIASSPEHSNMGNPGIRIDGLLQQAIQADASNPRPFFELATLRRFEKRHGEALELLKSASNRLGQSDSIMSVNLAKELVKLERLPDSDLAAAVPAGKDAQSLLCAAYAAARLGDPAKAAELVAQARTVVPPRTFFQLMKDPAFVPWRKEPALEKFFPKQKTN
jgi:hypothetical protein